MSMHHHTQVAIRTLSDAFAPLHCVIQSLNPKGNFSFTVLDEYGIARHSERLYPDQYLESERLQNVIDRTRRAVTA
jgi:hypothetical protein